MKVNTRNFEQELKSEDVNGLVELLVADRKDINLVIILCPLFKTGALNESVLMCGKDCSVASSRINSKWSETVGFIEKLIKKADLWKLRLNIDFLFADNGTPTACLEDSDFNVLRLHEKIWIEEIAELFGSSNLSFNIRSFSDIVPEIPLFMDVKHSDFLLDNFIDTGSRKVDFINVVNLQLEDWFSNSIDHPHIEINRKNKKRVMRLLGVFDIDTAFVMCTSYLGKRFRLPQIFSMSTFVWFERMDVLLIIDDMLEEFRGVKKIMIKV